MTMSRLTLTLMALTLGSALQALTIDAETDANADGLLSLEEMQAAMPSLTEELFILIDRTEDGLVDADELAEAQDALLLPESES